MTPSERVEFLLNMDPHIPEKDGAGVIIARGVDAAIRRKALEDCIKMLRTHEEKEKVQ